MWQIGTVYGLRTRHGPGTAVRHGRRTRALHRIDTPHRSHEPSCVIQGRPLANEATGSAAVLAERTQWASAGDLAKRTQWAAAGDLAERTQWAAAGDLAERTQRASAGDLAERTQRASAGDLAERTQQAAAGDLAERTQRAAAGDLAERSQERAVSAIEIFDSAAAMHADRACPARLGGYLARTKPNARPAGAGACRQRTAPQN